MENNQQTDSERNSAGQQQTTDNNIRPGQQLPTGKNSGKAKEERSLTPEQHSESSMPQNENETLGTP